MPDGRSPVEVDKEAIETILLQPWVEIETIPKSTSLEMKFDVAGRLHPQACDKDLMLVEICILGYALRESDSISLR